MVSSKETLFLLKIYKNLQISFRWTAFALKVENSLTFLVGTRAIIQNIQLFKLLILLKLQKLGYIESHDLIDIAYVSVPSS